MGKRQGAILTVSGSLLVIQSLLVNDALYVHHVLIPSPLFVVSILGFPVGIVLGIIGVTKLWGRKQA